ncbi:5303_t:CDS:2 [Paraglomus occultum]|uniref:5303_t:CDS:1 n=1 Tax=Paraglomus occultum TaxID=144539 RepID=A0A9N9FZE0_9GLOM|nr:5303_t:CDS:2 [Paraglomus occultum]
MVTLLSISTETIEIILDYLDTPDLVTVSLTCSLLYKIVSFKRYGLILPKWHGVSYNISDDSVAEIGLYYRNAVLIGSTLYILVFSIENPTAWIIDLNDKNPKWISVSMKVSDSYRPVKYPATSSILNKIYIHGGIDLLSGKPTNILYEFDVRDVQLQILAQEGTIPSARSMHSLNAIDHNHLAVYGGQCVTDDGPYDSKDFATYDIANRVWTIHDQIPNLPYARSLHCTLKARGRLYIYGGQRIGSKQKTELHTDSHVWAYDIRNHKWLRYISSTAYTWTPLKLPPEWIFTSGQKQSPGRRVGAAMFCIRNRIAIIGGVVGDNWEEGEIEKPWECLKIFSPLKKSWCHIRVQGLPRMSCVAFVGNWSGCIRKAFLIGDDAKTGKTTMGWIVG